MADTCRITVTTKSGKTHVGFMNRSQPEIMNGFIGIAQEDGAWIYLAPSDVLKMSMCWSKPCKMLFTRKEEVEDEVETKIRRLHGSRIHSVG